MTTAKFFITIFKKSDKKKTLGFIIMEAKKCQSAANVLYGVIYYPDTCMYAHLESNLIQRHI